MSEGTAKRHVAVQAIGQPTGVALRTVIGFLRRRARRDGVIDGRSGAVVIILRSGGTLNLTVHLHALVLDGVFAVEGGVVTFHPMGRLTREEVAGVVALIARRVERLLSDAGSRAAPRVAGRRTSGWAVGSNRGRATRGIRSSPG